MKHTSFYLCIAALALLMLCVSSSACLADEPDANTIVTIVETPDQTQPERPPCFPDPSAQFIPLPETENVALGKPVSSGAHTDVYVVGNVNDGKTDTYWESKGFPAEIVLDLESACSVSAVAVCLNPSSVWESRIQEIAVWISADGENYATVAEKAKYTFDPDTGNRVRIDFAPVEAAYVKVVFTMNSSSRTGGAQAAEINVYRQP